MERKYSEITDSVMNMCHSDRENWLVLRQIAYNLAGIADELAEANRLNAKTIGEIMEDLESHGLRPAEE